MSWNQQRGLLRPRRWSTSVYSFIVTVSNQRIEGDRDWIQTLKEDRIYLCPLPPLIHRGLHLAYGEEDEYDESEYAGQQHPVPASVCRRRRLIPVLPVRTCAKRPSTTTQVTNTNK